MKYLRAVLLSLLLVFIPAAASAQSSGCVDLSSDLAVGASGGQVTLLQSFLRSQGYFSASSVPHFGSATLAAVRAFQKANGISQTGTAGPKTRAAIKAASCSGTTGKPGVGTGAQSSFEVSGWIPYWRAATGTADVMPHLNLLSEVNPFVYTLKSDGTIFDNTDMTAAPWTTLQAAAKAQNVRYIPTIMSGDGDLLHALLSNSTKRVALEDRIANLVKANNFDGIDIDFEGKHAEDKNNFSTFLKGLYQRMGSKFVMCTIESRTPLNDRYFGSTIPADATIYANDFVQINKYCDRVRLMTYDQQGIDQALAAQAASSSQLYAPVADPRWVREVIQLVEQSIKPSKLMIGVPTYGYEYDVTAYANNEYDYKILWTFNQGYAWPIAKQFGVTPERNAAGELYFTYPSPNAPQQAPISASPLSAMMTALAATAYADANNSHQTFRLIDWPDAQSIAGKVELAQMLGVRGVSIFKLDGGEDPAIWTALLGAKQ